MMVGRVAPLVLIAGCIAPMSVPEPRSPEFARAEEAYLQGDTEKAAGLFARFRKDHPHSPHVPWALYFEGRALLVEGKPMAALQRLDEARRTAPDPALRAKVSMALGDAHFLQDRFAEAHDVYFSARGKGGVPADEVVYKMAVCSRRLGRWEEAERQFTEVVTHFPGSQRMEEATRHLAWKDRFFSIQVGIFRVRQNADGEADRMRAAGLDARAQAVGAGEDRLWRVTVGKYATYAEAKREMATLRGRQQITDALIVP
jgi:tetratricopeptide (TPR) repeat protein